jgi:ABC-type lipoprotein export system ATPase subunit
MTDGKTKEIPSFAQEINQVKKDAILLITHDPIFVDNINHVIKNSVTNNAKIDFHLTFLLFGEQR